MDAAARPQRIHREEPAITARLAQLGLDGVDLPRACVEGLQTALAQHSPFEPAIAFGIQRWAKTVDAMRKLLDEHGWRMSEDRNAPRSHSPHGQIVVAAVGGDEATGTDREPSNARVKGAVLAREARANAEVLGLPTTQPVLFEASFVGEGALALGRQTWVLLYYWDRVANEIRCELSLPVEFEDGMVTRWAERIIFPPVSLTVEVPATLLTGQPDDDVDFEIQAI